MLDALLSTHGIHTVLAQNSVLHPFYVMLDERNRNKREEKRKKK